MNFWFIVFNCIMIGVWGHNAYVDAIKRNPISFGVCTAFLVAHISAILHHMVQSIIEAIQLVG